MEELLKSVQVNLTWIIIGAAVLLALIVIIVIIAVAVKKSKAKKAERNDAPPVAMEETKSYEPAEEKVSEPVAEEPADEPAEEPAPVVAEEPQEEKPAAKAGNKEPVPMKPVQPKQTKSAKEPVPVKKAEKPVVTVKPVAKPAPAAKTEPKVYENKVYHISKRKEDGRWQIKIEGGAKAIKLFNTQAEAMDYGKTLAQNQDARIMLHKVDGSFRKLTY